MGEMRIGEVAERAGVRASAVRYYESVGLLPLARRQSGQRRYGPEVLLRLAGIRVAQEAGFRVSEIRRLFYGFPEDAGLSRRWADLAREKLVEIEDLIRRAREMKRLLETGISCGCSALDECILIDEAPRPTSSPRPRLAADRSPSG